MKNVTPKEMTVPIWSELYGPLKCDVWPAGGSIPGVVDKSIVFKSNYRLILQT